MRRDLAARINAATPHNRVTLVREAYEEGRRAESPEELEEIKQRALDALSGRNPSYSRVDSVARARAAVAAIRS